MHLPSFFGFGAKRIAAHGAYTEGVVTDVSACLWFRVNTKPLRMGMQDGAVYPHIVRFCYTADGTQYNASRILSWQVKPPAAGRRFRLCYDPSNPKRFAIPAF